MENYAGNGNVNYYNGHYKPPAPYGVHFNSPVAQIKFESEPYHAVEGDGSQGFNEFGGTVGYQTNTYQPPPAFDQEFGSLQTPGQPGFYSQQYENNNHTPQTNNNTRSSTPSIEGKTEDTKNKTASPSGGSNICDICQKVFSSNPSMRRHREIHSGQKKFSCELCGNSYTQKHNLTKHMRLHTGEKPYSCTLCDKSFYIHHHLKNHMVQHTGNYPYTCEVCSRGFKHKNKMEAHRKLHDNPQNPVAVSQSPHSGLVSEENSTSEIWADDTEEEDASRDMLEFSFDEEEKKYDEHECEVCQQIFINKESLENHMKMHTVDTEFKCEECSSIFLTRAHLVRHRKSHTGETIYNCEECNVSFRWKVSLHIHMRRHNNDYKRHECNLCNKYFLARSSLKKHMNTHLGLTIYDCEECGEKFTVKAEFQDHVQTEHPVEEVSTDATTATPKKPTCKTCHKTFSSNSSLRKHEYTHLDVKPHKCDICNVSFAQKIQLRLHNKKHNGVVDPPMTLEQRKEQARKEVERRREARELLRQKMEKARELIATKRNTPRKARNVLKEAEESSEESEDEDDDEESESGSESGSDDDEDSDDSETEEEDEKKKTSPWKNYKYPVCEYCNQSFKKTGSYKRHLKACKRKHTKA